MSTPIIKVENLSKTYSKAKVAAVDKISFEVFEGEFFCLLGVNGAGKSTTINIICTLLEKTSGNVEIDGYILGAGKDEFAIKRRIGVVFQGNVLDDMLSVHENLFSRAAFYGLERASAKIRIEALIEELNMKDFVKKRYGKLSGGQRRKCDIARALLAEPKILFLDEPTTGLDPQSRIDLWRVIENLRKKDKMTVFLTTHYMEETDDADRVAIMDKGNILCIDTPQRLKSIYSTNILRLTPKDGQEKEIEKMLGNFERVADSYDVKIPENIDAINLLEKLKPYLDSFEMKKGNMDSVFLTVVGRKAI